MQGSVGSVNSLPQPLLTHFGMMEGNRRDGRARYWVSDPRLRILKFCGEAVKWKSYLAGYLGASKLLVPEPSCRQLCIYAEHRPILDEIVHVPTRFHHCSTVHNILH